MSVHRLSRNKKRWYFQFYFNGKKIKKEVWNHTPMLTKQEALQCEIECLEKLKREQQQKEGYMTLYELFEEYLNSTKSNLKESSLKVYSNFKTNYINDIGNKIIYQLTNRDILSFRNKIANSNSTAAFKNRIVNIMLFVLKYGNLMYNLSSKLQFVLLEKFKDKEIKINKSKHLPLDDFKLMMTYLDLSIDSDFYYYTIFNTLYFTGLRIGELAALTINDFKDNYIIVNKDYVRVSGKDIIQPPKSTNSVRSILLDKDLIDLLNSYIEKFKPKEILFSRNKKYLTQQRVREILNRVAQASELDLKYDISPHTLRHSHASNLRELGFDIFTIANRLGNTPDVSASTYVHSNADEQEKIIEKIEKMNALVQK